MKIIYAVSGQYAKVFMLKDVTEADLAVSPGQLLEFASHATFSLVLYRGIYNRVLKCTTVQMAAQ